MAEPEIKDEGSKEEGLDAQYEWRCKDCDEKAPPTAFEYMQFIRHKKGHHVGLFNITTQELIANSPREAENKGIFIPKAEKNISDETGGKAITVNNGMAKVTVTLPVQIWAMYDAAADYGRRPSGQPFDEWLADCVQLAFNIAYRLEFALVPFEVEDTSGDGASADKEKVGRK